MSCPNRPTSPGPSPGARGGAPDTGVVPDLQAVPSSGAVLDHGAQPSALRYLLPQRPSELTASNDPRNRPRAWFLHRAAEISEPGRSVFTGSGSGGRRIPTRLRLLEQTPSRRSFLFDPVATDLISFDADGCNSTGYGPLGDPLLSFTGRDPFFGAHTSPLAGLSPSAARLTAEIAAPSPSYRGHSGVGGNALTDPSGSRAQGVDDVVCEPACLTDNVAAFTDARWP
ncbi:hypothetical protein HPB51_014237 [Rhipicephalus microplus]|uniref:Uncharacterized protein n=1 Tax=Rhipicephalus microplus TaxID=6941 RepID=A0A9J6D5A5_RHIMP|nr:hypothetical protein HPB51_014237 [Rhipicephalus microplus]